MKVKIAEHPKHYTAKRFRGKIGKVVARTDEMFTVMVDFPEGLFRRCSWKSEVAIDDCEIIPDLTLGEMALIGAN